MSDQFDAGNSLHSLYNHLAFPSRDFSVDALDAWSFGIVVGWSNVELPDVSRRHKWDDASVSRLKRLNADFRKQCGFAPRLGSGATSMSTLPKPTEDPIDSLELCLCASARDNSLDKRDAWIYGIIIGWGEATDYVAKRHGWDRDTVDRLHRIHEKFKALSGGVSKRIVRSVR